MLTIDPAGEFPAITPAAPNAEKSTIPSRSSINARSSRWNAQMLEVFVLVFAALYLISAVALGFAFAILHDQSIDRVLPF
ncbi:MAG: hypothetical protein JO313_10470 [Verrucomicrobia bacterium]|nr:hypothetical protein [Verrucomicrobiota bacterium]